MGWGVVLGNEGRGVWFGSEVVEVRSRLELWLGFGWMDDGMIWVEMGWYGSRRTCKQGMDPIWVHVYDTHAIAREYKSFP